MQFGNGGQLCDPGVNGSAHYCANQTLGETAVGNASSSNFQAQAGGIVTDRDTYVQMIVTGANIDLGQLTTSSTKVASGNFSVKTYLASGYQVVTAANPPTYATHSLAAMSGGASSTGTEQFGINLVANSCPSNTPTSGAGSCSGGFGAGPVQVPDSTFSFGTVASGYNTPNVYKYNKGDVIAQSSQSSGETDYTISYLFNISPVTPAGTYKMTHVLVATSTF